MAIPLRIGRVPEPGADGYLERMRGILQAESAELVRWAVSLPFSLDDATAGSESIPAGAR